ncbi:hypothetical protein BJ165DRAFT_758758 [Panaeolus papilionaceus]|nr:hypothetical protein BJ165DRAFT_758758 [Panaeolus papilionaceus]
MDSDVEMIEPTSHPTTATTTTATTSRGEAKSPSGPPHSASTSRSVGSSSSISISHLVDADSEEEAAAGKDGVGKHHKIPVVVHSPSPSLSPRPTPQPGSMDSKLKGEDISADPSAPASASASAPPASSSSATGEGATSTGTVKPTSSAPKPRSKAAGPSSKARSPSPSPPPPPVVVPLQTVRLNITLGGPSNYEVDIRLKAKETGQRAATPPVGTGKGDEDSESEDEDEGAEKGKAGEKEAGVGGEGEEGGSVSVNVAVGKKRRKRKPMTSEYYDTTDPFIDDSELALDERQFFAQTKQQGFYVSSGEVALLKDKTPRKPKSKKITFAAGISSALAGAGSSHETPIQVDGGAGVGGSASVAVGSTKVAFKDSVSLSAPVGAAKREGSVAGLGGTGVAGGGISVGTGAPGVDGAGAGAEVHAGQKRKRHNSIITEGGKKKKVVDESKFHPSLQEALKEVRELVAKESWEQKGKFPPGLKPPLAKLAILAIKVDEYDDDFFSLMPSIFPYNKFTMTKLIKRTVYPEHYALLTDRQEVLLKELEQLAKDGFAKAQEEYEKSVALWDKRQEKLRAEVADASGTPSAAPTRQGTEEMDVDAPPVTPLHPDGDNDGKDGHTKDGGKDGKEGKDGKDGKDHSQHPPSKRYRMTDVMKQIVWELVLLSNECCRLENEKNNLEGSVIQISDQGLRKVLYQKIVAAFPDGWMSSGQISRDVSAIKKRLEREAAEAGEED